MATFTTRASSAGSRSISRGHGRSAGPARSAAFSPTAIARSRCGPSASRIDTAAPRRVRSGGIALVSGVQFAGPRAAGSSCPSGRAHVGGFFEYEHAFSGGASVERLGVALRYGGDSRLTGRTRTPASAPCSCSAATAWRAAAGSGWSVSRCSARTESESIPWRSRSPDGTLSGVPNADSTLEVDATRYQREHGRRDHRRSARGGARSAALRDPRRELGRGGMGRVSLADDVILGRSVAIKELLDRGGDLAARFRRELALTARLQHPSIRQRPRRRVAGPPASRSSRCTSSPAPARPKIARPGPRRAARAAAERDRGRRRARVRAQRAHHPPRPQAGERAGRRLRRDRRDRLGPREGPAQSRARRRDRRAVPTRPPRSARPSWAR